jgi:hypothetical protein
MMRSYLLAAFTADGIAGPAFVGFPPVILTYKYFNDRCKSKHRPSLRHSSDFFRLQTIGARLA